MIKLTTQRGIQVSVLMGWDRQMQQFFLIVEDMQAKDEDSPYLYSNLNDPEAWGKRNLDYFIGKLEKLELKIPQSMVEQMWIDKNFNAGNRLVSYMPDGTFVERHMGTT